MFHAEIEAREMLCLFGEEIQQVPLGHEGDVFALRGKVTEIGCPKKVFSEFAADKRQLLMRNLRKLCSRPSS